MKTATQYIIQKVSDTGPYPINVGSYVLQRTETARERGFAYTDEVAEARLYPTTMDAIEEIRQRDAQYSRNTSRAAAENSKFMLLPVVIETVTKIVLLTTPQ